ncbi:hypothetical protein [Clostridium sp.]|uniref:hypothetical protein n=1 Tax=Clostridium sp. TaxID=1506 RepID=UPI003F379E61
MQYIILTLGIILFAFVGTLVFTSVINKEKALKENMKYAFMILLFAAPIFLLVGGSLFLAFKLISMLVSIDISNYQLFVVAISGVFIIFIGDFISKKVTTSIAANTLAKKYEGKDITEKQMMEILNKSQKSMREWMLVMMFITSTVLYMLIMSLVSIEFTWVFLILISSINILSYLMFFRVKQPTGN